MEEHAKLWKGTLFVFVIPDIMAKHAACRRIFLIPGYQMLQVIKHVFEVNSAYEIFQNQKILLIGILIYQSLFWHVHVRFRQKDNINMSSLGFFISSAYL